MNGKLPEVLIRPGPKHIVPFGAKRLDNRLRKVFVGEEAHLCRNRIGLIFVGQVAGIGQTGENVVSRKTRIVCQKLVLRLARGKESENEFDGQTRAPDHRFADHHFRIDDNAFRKLHIKRIACQCTLVEAMATQAGTSGAPIYYV